MKSYIKKDKKNSLFFVIAFSISVLVTSIVLTLFVRFNNNPTPIISKQILEKKEVDTRINLFSYIMHKTNNDRAKALAAVKSLDNDYSEFIADYKNNSDDSGTLKLRNPDGSDSGQTADYYETLYGFLVNKESAYGMAYSDLNYLKMNLEERTKQKISNDEQQNLEYTTKIENYLRDIENYEDRNFVTDDLSTNILLSGNNEYDKTRAVAQWFNAHVDRLNVKSFDSWKNLLWLWNLDGISDGDMIDPSYFSSMFTYDYDVTMGVLYKKESFSDEELKTVNPDSSYVEQFDNLETRDLSSFVGEKSSYGIGEVVPFYKLLAKITNIDFSTNSHQVQFDLKFGIQSVKDPTIEVFVNDDVSEPVDGLDLKNLTRHLTCDITSLDDVKLIAQKVLYQKDDTTKTTLNSSDFSQVATNVVKWKSTIPEERVDFDKSSTLMEIARKKDAGELSEETPYLIKAGEEDDIFSGLQFPSFYSNNTIVNDDGKEVVSNNFHVNQSFAAEVIDCNNSLNDLWIKFRWVIIDDFNDEVSEVVCGQEASTPFKFSLSSIENNFVELTYKVSQDFMDNLFLASTMAVSLFAAKCYNDVSFAETSGELASNLHKQFVWEIAWICVDSTVAATSIVLAAINMCSFAATLGFGVVFFIYATTLTLQAGVAVTTAALRAKNAFLKADCFDDIQKLDAVFKEYPRISIYDDFVAQNPNRVILDDIETLNNPASNILRLQELMDIYLPYNESGMYDEIVPVFNKMLSLDFKTEYFREFSEQVKQYDTGCSDFAKQLDPKTDIQKEINDSYLSITGYIGIALTTIAFFAAPVWSAIGPTLSVVQNALTNLLSVVKSILSIVEKVLCLISRAFIALSTAITVLSGVFTSLSKGFIVLYTWAFNGVAKIVAAITFLQKSAASLFPISTPINPAITLLVTAIGVASTFSQWIVGKLDAIPGTY